MDIISVYSKVAMHQGSVLSPLLFGVGMNVIPRKTRSGISSEWPIMELLGRRVTE